MYDNATKDKFIELRAAGWSHTRIASELNIDRKTVCRWNQQFGASIENLRQRQLEDLQQRLMGSQQQRFSELVEEYQRYRDALKARNPDRIPQHTLFHIFPNRQPFSHLQNLRYKAVPFSFTGRAGLSFVIAPSRFFTFNFSFLLPTSPQ